MSESTPPAPDPEKKTPAYPNLYVDSPPPARDGCLSLAGGSIAGFILFIMIGGLALSANNGSLAIAYCIVSFIFALWLALRPGWRGVGIGIFLGLGAVLLVMAICSGMHFG